MKENQHILFIMYPHGVNHKKGKGRARLAPISSGSLHGSARVPSEEPMFRWEHEV